MFKSVFDQQIKNIAFYQFHEVAVLYRKILSYFHKFYMKTA